MLKCVQNSLKTVPRKKSFKSHVTFINPLYHQIAVTRSLYHIFIIMFILFKCDYTKIPGVGRGISKIVQYSAEYDLASLRNFLHTGLPTKDETSETIVRN